jgi:hypothetical protein
VVLLVVLLLTLASLLLAPRVLELFGESGANVLSRALGVLLAALAVQSLVDGVKESFALQPVGARPDRLESPYGRERQAVRPHRNRRRAHDLAG